MANAVELQPTIMRRIGRVLGTTLLFLIVGPPVGGIVFVLLVALIGMGKSADISGLTWIALFALIYAVPFSYLIGFGPSLAAGLLVGLKREWTGRVGWGFAVLAGIVVAVGYFVATGQSLRLAADAGWDRLVMAPTCIVSTLVCWAIERAIRK